MRHRVMRSDSARLAARGSCATSLPAVCSPVAKLVRDSPAREGRRSSCRKQVSINCNRSAHWSPGSVRGRRACCAGLAHRHSFDRRRAVLARPGFPCAPPTANPLWHRHFMQVLLPASSRRVHCRCVYAMIGKEVERREVRSSTRTSPNNYMQRAGIHKMHALNCSAKFSNYTLRSDLSARSLMSGSWAPICRCARGEVTYSP
jgi:hypothetical protein